MSNRGPALGALLTLSAAGGAWAQSRELVEAIRIHGPGATERAQEELRACLQGDAGTPDAGAAPCERARQLALLAGFLRLSDGAAAEAATQLKATPAPPRLEAFHAWYLGEAQAWSGEKGQAVKALARAGKTAPAWLKRRIDARLGELYLELGLPKKALPLLEAAVAQAPTPELLYARALARRAGGNAAGAKQDLLAVLVGHPAHPHAALAEALLGAPVLGFEERLARAERLLGAGDSAKAWAEVDGLAPPPSKAKGRKGANGARSAAARLALLQAQILYARGDEPRAAERLDAAMGGPPSVAAEAMMLRARKAMRAGEHRVARELFDAIDHQYPDSPAADEGAYLGAWLAVQAGNYEVAVREFEHFDAHHQDSRKRDEARWFKGYALFRAEQYAKAREVLASLITDFPRTSLVPQARYWMARALHLEKQDAAKAAVTEELASLVRDFPGTFYAQLARERLRELGAAPPVLFGEPPKALDVAPPAALGLALELSRAGLLRDAWEEVQEQVQAVRSADDALVFGHALQAVGEFGAAHALAARHLWGKVYGARQPEALALMYPRAYRDAVERFSRQRNLDPFFAWAIMRRESNFRAEVASAADARGLMQIIPPTARAIAKELKLEAPDPDSLYSPEQNILMGTWYLSALLQRFGHPGFGAAAYNAGPPAVAKWAKERGTLPLDLWVEDIAYKETRGYVKQVLADWCVYRALYGTPQEQEARVALTLPVPKSEGVAF